MSPLERLVGLLDLERIEVDIFRGHQPPVGPPRVFGGQVAAQALVAAARTVADDRPVHSLHSYFLRPGDPSVPIVFTVDRIRDGRSFTTRRVVAVQHGEAIFNLQASFQVVEQGLSHQDPMPIVPGPEGLEPLHVRMAPYADEFGGLFVRPRPIDVRHVGDPPRVARDTGERRDRSQVWMRADGHLGDDPLLHAAVLTYASDMSLLDPVVMIHGKAYGSGDVMLASLDHAIWFHEGFRADEWFLYAQHSPWTGGARGLARGSVYTEGGRRVASVVQEGLIREPR